MKNPIMTVRSNEKIAAAVWKLVLEGDTSSLERPGQFVNVKVEGLYLRRPISVSDWSENELVLIYKVVGKGTEKMTELAGGDAVDLLSGLGNGYDISRCGRRPVLVGGGVGVPPLYGLCKALIKEGKKPVVILGFNREDEIFLDREFRELGAEVHIATLDGSVGVKGFVTDALDVAVREDESGELGYLFTCGPLPMMKALKAKVDELGWDGQFSLEERMGCGFGGCMGCSLETPKGPIRICKEGPVLGKEMLPW